MSNDKVTIVIPVYNSEKFLIPTIESALNQSYQNLEIIAVDDGSTDNTNSLVKSLLSISNLNHTYIAQKNKGPGAARNHGCEHANGDFFIFVVVE